SPVPQPTPVPSASAKISASGVTVNLKTGNVQLDGIVKDLANVVTNSVGAAFKQAGAELARSGRMQAADTGRVALMIKILATDTDASVRRTAAWGLQEVETADVRQALVKSMRSDADERVREMAAWALGEQGNAAAGPALSDALLHDKNS